MSALFKPSSRPKGAMMTAAPSDPAVVPEPPTNPGPPIEIPQVFNTELVVRAIENIDEGKVIFDFTDPITKPNGTGITPRTYDFRQAEQPKLTGAQIPVDDFYPLLIGIPGLDRGTVTGYRQVTLQFGHLYLGHVPFHREIRALLHKALKAFCETIAGGRNIRTPGLEPPYAGTDHL